MLPPWYDHWCRRNAPLAACPDAGCRRAGVCRKVGADTPCLRTHHTMDEARIALADKLDRLHREMIARRGHERRPATRLERDRNMAHMKSLLEDSVTADMPRRIKEMAEEPEPRPYEKKPRRPRGERRGRSR